MASAPVKYYCGISGLGSITCTLYPKGSESGASVATITLTEIGTTGVYSGTTSAGLSGLHWAVLTSGMVDGGFVVMSDDTADHVIQAGAAVYDKTGTLVGTDAYAALTGANTELSAVPSSTASLVSMLKWLFLLGRNKRTQTATTETVLANDNSTSVATSTKSDDGTTFTRGKYS